MFTVEMADGSSEFVKFTGYQVRHCQFTAGDDVSVRGHYLGRRFIAVAIEG